MKKTLSIVLALVMVLSLSAFAFAADIPAGNIAGGTSKEVTGKYTGTNNHADTVYSVVIAWNVTNYVYTGADNTYTWVPGDLKYTGTAGTATVQEAKVSVVVTNSSNAGINVVVKYADSDTDSINTTATWTNVITTHNNGTSFATTGNQASNALGTAAVDAEGLIIGVNETAKTGTAQSCEFSAAISITNPENLSETEQTIGTVTVELTPAG